MDDETFARIIGDDTTDPATDDPSAADETAIAAAVPDEGDVPEEDVGESEPEPESDEGAVDAAAEEEVAEESVAQPEVIPITDERHPDHAYYLKAKDADEQKAKAQAVLDELARVQAMREIENTIKGLPDTDPDQLIPTVQALLAKVVAPIRQESQAQAQMAEQAAGVATTLHLAMKALLPPEWVAALEAKSRELGRFGTWEAASHIVETERAVSARESAEVAALRSEVATLRKQMKARERDPNADRVPSVHPASTPGRQPSGVGSKFDQFFDAEVLGLGG